jgi:aminomethyltransferase
VAELRRTPLHARHRAAGARLVPFAGFEMPVAYGSIVDEHRHVRSQAGLFDVSHMGEVRLRGRDALALAQRVFTNDVLGMRDGQVRYGMLCCEPGGVIDDVTLYRVSESELFFCLNASRTAEDLAWLREVLARERFACDLRDESDATALLALQGPLAVALAHRLADAPEAAAPRRWRFATARLAGIPLVLSRTGYTGEDGYELYLAAERAAELWDALLAVGGERVRPIGLGARDTLRTEMGYALYGHELSLERTPLDAGLERFVRFGRGFIGEARLAAQRAEGPRERLVGLELEGRAVARPGYPILVDGERGEVTSGTFAPSVERSIAMGYVPAASAQAGRELEVEIRSKRIPCRVCTLPFHRPGPERKPARPTSE